MRGTTSKADFDEFAKAVMGFPPTERDGKTAQLVFQDSYTALDVLAKKAPTFPRAMAWKAYALALSVYEGWPLPPSADEEKMGWQARLDEALRLADLAVKEDNNDYDLHWALADVHLIRGEFNRAVEEFEIAVDLNRDARHPSLFAEAAAAMTQAGEFDKAEAYFRKARTPDWHHWSRGTYLFLKAGRATGGDRESFLNLTVDDLKSTRAQFGDDLYQGELQLVLAAAHWRRWELYDQKAASTSNAADKALFARIAARNLAAATRSIHTFQAQFPYWSAKLAADSVSLQNPDDRAWWQDTINALWAIP